MHSFSVFNQRQCLSLMSKLVVGLAIVAWLAISQRALAVDEPPLPQAWEYADAMRQVVKKSNARSGVVLHIGDSITYANPYGQWPRSGEGKTEEDIAVLKWM